MNELITNLIKQICSDLNIEVPGISNDVSMFPTSTTIAMADVEKNIIYIKEQNVNPDLIFAIIHELRHMWQYKTNKIKYMHNYKTSKELSVEEYNLQIAEIDANAYAGLIMINNFGLKPQWNGLSDNVIRSIEKRITELITNK